MQVTVSARHGHLSEEHQGQIREKAEKLLHFFDRLLEIDVIVNLAEAHQYSVEVLAEAEHKQEFVAQETGPDMMVCLNHAIEKVKHQIKHYKERIQDHRRNPSHGGPGGIKP